jgi:hypothetical protein
MHGGGDTNVRMIQHDIRLQMAAIDFLLYRVA